MSNGEAVVWINLGVVLFIGILQLYYTYIFSTSRADNKQRCDDIHENELRSIRNEGKIKEIEKICKIKHKE